MLLIVILSLFMFCPKVTASVPTASSNISYSQCLAFSDAFRTISDAMGGTYYYKWCYRATCSYGVYNKANMVANYGYRCQNGNGTPYTNVTSDGCKSYSGSCNTSNSTYCTKVTYIDCNRTSSGAPYQGGTTTTKKTTTTTTTARISKTTTKKTTTTKRTTTKKTTTIPTSTTSTTTARPISNNTNIKNLTINKTEIGYKNSKDTYTIKLPYDVSSVDVFVELEDERSTYEVTGNSEMPNEEHQIKIVVTAESGEKRTVTINVKRYTTESNDCNLANIYIEDYSLDFSKNVYDYKLKLPKNVTSLDLEVVVSDEENATYEIQGNEKLKNNSKVVIEVKAEDGTLCYYTIKIKKSSNAWKYIVLIVLLLGALITASVFLYRYLKKSKGKYKYE